MEWPVGRLNLRVGEEQPFVPRFLMGFRAAFVRPSQAAPEAVLSGRSARTVPCHGLAARGGRTDRSDLLSGTAQVEPYADVSSTFMSAARSGHCLRSIRVGPERRADSRSRMARPGSPILECLKLGVALHHGALPTAYRKEVERLLREGVLKVTISSPTLAQGLNLSATTVIMHSLVPPWRDH